MSASAHKKRFIILHCVPALRICLERAVFETEAMLHGHKWVSEEQEHPSGSQDMGRVGSGGLALLQPPAWLRRHFI